MAVIGLSRSEIRRLAAQHCCANGNENCGEAAIEAALRLQRERIITAMREAGTATLDSPTAIAKAAAGALHGFALRLENEEP